jgi:hypothetical protein
MARLGSLTISIPGMNTPSCTTRPQNDNRMLIRRSAMPMTWKLAVDSACTSSVCRWKARHLVAITLCGGPARAGTTGLCRQRGSSSITRATADASPS